MAGRRAARKAMIMRNNSRRARQGWCHDLRIFGHPSPRIRNVQARELSIRGRPRTRSPSSLSAAAFFAFTHFSLLSRRFLPRLAFRCISLSSPPRSPSHFPASSPRPPQPPSLPLYCTSPFLALQRARLTPDSPSDAALVKRDWCWDDGFDKGWSDKWNLCANGQGNWGCVLRRRGGCDG